MPHRIIYLQRLRFLSERHSWKPIGYNRLPWDLLQKKTKKNPEPHLLLRIRHYQNK